MFQIQGKVQGRQHVAPVRAPRRWSMYRPLPDPAHSIQGAPEPAPGTCYLVGAGPGDPDLLTLRAIRLLEQAQVVVYDDLGAQGVLDLVPATAERIYVGKRGGQAGSAKQQNIDSLLVDLCKQGKDVVRLKGGCPSVFSRVGSELTAMRQAGISCVLVPGISSALAAPLLGGGFPLTDVDVGTSFAVLTGHSPDQVGWPAFNGIPTLVVLMGGAALPQIVNHLVNQGRPLDTAVCVIRDAGQSQTVWRGTLESIVHVTGGEKLSPCVIVIGQVTSYWQ